MDKKRSPLCARSRSFKVIMASLLPPLWPTQAYPGPFRDNVVEFLESFGITVTLTSQPQFLSWVVPLGPSHSKLKLIVAREEHTIAEDSVCDSCRIIGKTKRRVCFNLTPLQLTRATLPPRYVTLSFLLVMIDAMRHHSLVYQWCDSAVERLEWSAAILRQAVHKGKHTAPQNIFQPPPTSSHYEVETIELNSENPFR